MGTVWRSFFFEKFLILFFYRFLTFSDNIPVFCRKFFVTAVRTAFWLSKGTFWENCSSETFFPFAQWAKNFGLSSQKVFAHSSKWHPRRPEAQFGEECFFVLKKKTVFFPMLLYLGKNWSIFSWKDFRSVVKNALCVSMETICGRKFFCEKIFFLLISNIGPCVCHFWNFLAWICQNCIQNVHLPFEEKFFWKVFFVTLGYWAKIVWFFCRRFSGGIVKPQYTYARAFSENKYFYSGKKAVFTVMLGYWSHSFSAICQHIFRGFVKTEL